MIAVIADDFTGAAEIAGLGLRYGLTVEIESHVFSESNADLVIIATDTRSLNKDEAHDEVMMIAKQLQKTNYDWIYKKTDSVFRGHIYNELKAMLEINGYKKAILVPANPSLGRKIENGIYYVGNKFLHETNFSEDPDFSLTTSNVIELMQHLNDLDVSVKKPSEGIELPGITIGEAVSEEDLKKWAAKINKATLPAGGAGFFAALLEANDFKIQENIINEDNPLGKKFLFVCGSAFSKGKEAFEDVDNCEKKIYPMPDDVFNKTGNSDKAFTDWKSKIIESFKEMDSVVIEIDQPVVRDKRFSKRLRETMAELVEQICSEVKVNELLIDGGATVNAIAQRAGLRKFQPVQELAPGVIRMKVEGKEDLYVTIKPGSYAWPKSLLDMPCK